MTDLTERQAQLHRYLCERWSDPPTVREMAEHLGGIGVTAVMGHLKALAAKGYIEKADGLRSRGVKLLQGPDLDGSFIEIAGRTYQLVASEEIAF
jgi:SOS-response transcriptional repressor LexA